jgi:hypothetical protein
VALDALRHCIHYKACPSFSNDLIGGRQSDVSQKLNLFIRQSRCARLRIDERLDSVEAISCSLDSGWAGKIDTDRIEGR